MSSIPITTPENDPGRLELDVDVTDAALRLFAKYSKLMADAQDNPGEVGSSSVTLTKAQAMKMLGEIVNACDFKVRGLQELDQQMSALRQQALIGVRSTSEIMNLRRALYYIGKAGVALDMEMPQ